MSAYSWIVLGILALAFSGFAIPYGFYLRGKPAEGSASNPPVSVTSHGQKNGITANTVSIENKTVIQGSIPSEPTSKKPSQYKAQGDTQSQQLTGSVTFDYSSHDGRYKIGDGDLLFETQWSKASDTCIHIYKDPPSIDSLALVTDRPYIESIRSIVGFDFSSRVRTPNVGEIVVLKNKYGNYAALKILNIKDRTRSGSVDEVKFEYKINPNSGTDFR